MRRTLTAAVAVAAWLASAAPLWAGVYNPAEPAVWPLPGRFDQFQDLLGQLRSIVVEKQDPPLPPESPARVHYRTRAAELQARERTDGLTVRERVALSAYLIRLAKYEDAVRVLTPVEGTDDPHRFLVLANLATASQLADRLDRAVEYLGQALEAWPHVWHDFEKDQLAFYRLAERYHLKLLQLRQQEARLRPGRPPEAVDALFAGVQFTGAGGQYEPGELVAEQRDELPPGRLSVGIVGQLALWLPLDDRLYWLLGEVLNAQGDVTAAATVLDQLVYGRRFAARAAVEHRQVLLKTREAASTLTGEGGALAQEELLWQLAPRGGTLLPGAGSLVNETAWAAACSVLTDPLGTNPPPPPAGWMPNARDVAVGFLAGAVVALLVAIQFRGKRAGKAAALG